MSAFARWRRGFTAAIAKDLHLLVRDRVGLVFLTAAPMIVTTVAGFSLASLYGADPRGESGYVVPLVDEDRGALGRALREALSRSETVSLRPVGSRAEAEALLASHEAGAAIVVPAGVSAALASGGEAKLVLVSDPVKYLEVANVRAILQEARHRIEGTARLDAERKTGALRAQAEIGRQRLKEASARAEEALRRLGEAIESLRKTFRERAAGERERIAAELRRRVEERSRAARRRLEALLAPARSFLAELDASERAFTAWLEDAKRQAGSYADRLPAPPAAPAVPEEVRRLATLDADALAKEILGDGDLLEGLDVSLPDLPAPPALPAFALPELPSVDLPPLGGSLELEEEPIAGAPRRINTFDQNVPGFSVTFLLLGMLFGVSLSLVDEREWGTLERIRSTPTPLGALLVAKLAARFLVGVAQMALLFALGRIAFGVSLGPSPWALALPTVGIVFTATALGLLVAGLSRSREAVLPIGSIVIVTMAAVGGCWWPIDLEPAWMRHAARVLPTTWAMAAYNDLMIRRRGVEAALVPTAFLLAFGATFLLAGLTAFRRQVAR